MITTKPAEPAASPPAGEDEEPFYRRLAEICPDPGPAEDPAASRAGDIPADVDVWADFGDVGDGGTTTTHDDLAWDGVELDVGTQVVAGDCAGHRCPATVVARGEAGQVVLRLDLAAR